MREIGKEMTGVRVAEASHWDDDDVIARWYFWLPFLHMLGKVTFNEWVD